MKPTYRMYVGRIVTVDSFTAPPVVVTLLHGGGKGSKMGYNAFKEGLAAENLHFYADRLYELEDQKTGEIPKDLNVDGKMRACLYGKMDKLAVKKLLSFQQCGQLLVENGYLVNPKSATFFSATLPTKSVAEYSDSQQDNLGPYRPSLGTVPPQLIPGGGLRVQQETEGSMTGVMEPFDERLKQLDSDLNAASESVIGNTAEEDHLLQLAKTSRDMLEECLVKKGEKAVERGVGDMKAIDIMTKTLAEHKAADIEETRKVLGEMFAKENKVVMDRIEEAENNIKKVIKGNNEEHAVEEGDKYDDFVDGDDKLDYEHEDESVESARKEMEKRSKEMNDANVENARKEIEKRDQERSDAREKAKKVEYEMSKAKKEVEERHKRKELALKVKEPKPKKNFEDMSDGELQNYINGSEEVDVEEVRRDDRQDGDDDRGRDRSRKNNNRGGHSGGFRGNGRGGNFKRDDRRGGYGGGNTRNEDYHTPQQYRGSRSRSVVPNGRGGGWGRSESPEGDRGGRGHRDERAHKKLKFQY